MPTTAVIILTALVTAVGGYLLNQLPEVRQFKGRNWLIIRLFVWITLLPVAYELWTDEKVLTEIKKFVQYSFIPLILLLVQDLWTLVPRLREESSEISATVSQDLRIRVLRKIQNEVAERLEDSLNQSVVINLLMQQQLHQVNRPEKQKQISLEEIVQKRTAANTILMPSHSLKHNDQETKLNPQESILDTFNRRDVGRKLLILGAPGAGKTITLLKLAEALVEEALQDEQQPIPVIFELSTWKADSQPISNWLIEQLNLNYNIDLKTGANWLQQTRLLPLLDGLDELQLRRQKICVKRINEFMKRLLYPHAVVCCRSEEYAAGKILLKTLKGSVFIEPLSDQQIYQYLCSQLKRPEIWQAIQQQPKLQTLLNSSKNREIGILRIPLFLNILSIAYHPEMKIETDNDLLDAYIDKRLAIKTREIEHEQLNRRWAFKTVEKEPRISMVRRHLSWLAFTLKRDNLVELLIEGMQPQWLSTQRQRFCYFLIESLMLGFILGLIEGLRAGIIGGFIAPLIGGMEKVSTAKNIRFSMPRKVSKELRKIFLDSLFLGLISGLVLGFVEGVVLGCILGTINIFKINLEYQDQPNQGIWATLNNLFLISIIIYPLSIGLTIFKGGLIGQQFLLAAFLKRAAVMTFIGSIFIGSGFILIQHLVLRIIFFCTGHTPWNYARFLNYCVERRLLQRIGGRYRFIHRELLDHFAEM